MASLHIKCIDDREITLDLTEIVTMEFNLGNSCEECERKCSEETPVQEPVEVAEEVVPDVGMIAIDSNGVVTEFPKEHILPEDVYDVPIEEQTVIDHVVRQVTGGSPSEKPSEEEPVTEPDKKEEPKSAEFVQV